MWNSYSVAVVVGAVLCLCLAGLIGANGLWAVTRRPGGDIASEVARAVAPTQIAAAAMLTAGAIVALAAPAGIGLTGLIIGIIGAIATIMAGSWQGARYANARRDTDSCASAGGCTGCEQLCRAPERRDEPV